MKIGIGIVGTGFGRAVHIPAWQACAGAEVVAVYSRDLAKARAIADQFQIPHACNALDQFLALPQVQAVAIASPPFLHYDQAKAAIAAGKHLILEKPVTLNLSEAILLYQLAKQHQVIAAVDFEFRFIPQWRYLDSLLAQNYVGKIRAISIDWIVSGRANPERPWNWYAQKGMGGGALGALASHSFDYIRWLFGDVKRLCGHLNTAIAQRPDANGAIQTVDADDTCDILLELQDATSVNLRISTVAYAGEGHWLRVYGDLGTLAIGSNNLKDYGHGFSVRYAKAGEEQLTFMPVPGEYDLAHSFTDGRIAPLVALGDRFIEAINQADLPDFAPSLWEGIHSQQLMDLTHQSHLERKWIEVENLAR